MNSYIRDLVHAARSLAKDRGFTLVCVISLGIGMGGLVALATFTRMITAPARVIDTRGLVELLVVPDGPLRAKAGEWAIEPWSYPDYRALRDADAGMAVTGWTRDASEAGDRAPDGAAPPRVTTLYVSANYFSTFGVSLALGSGFDPAIDDAASAEPRVVVNHDFWKSRMAADPQVIGKSLTVDGVPHTVVGVAPDDFRGHFHFFVAPGSLLFIPLERHPRLRSNPALRDDRNVDWVQIHGRLNQGVDITQANAMVSAVAASLAQRYPASNEFKAATVEPYSSMGAAGRPESRRVISVILALAGAVLIIVCLNISGMMLVRGANRERELSIRAALGASRRSLIQHLFFEAILLAFVGGALSAFVLFGIPAIAGWYLGAPVPPEVDLDATGVAIATGLCLIVSVLFGMLPAVRFSRPNLIQAMKENTGGGRAHTIRVHRVAAMVQIGIAIPFLAISGVMLDRVRTAEFGFPTEGLAAARLPASATSGQDAGFAVRKVRDDLQQTSGVRSVAVASGMPIDFDSRLFRVAGTKKDQFVTAQVTRVGENFLETIGARLLRGRTITAEDRLANAPVTVISAPLATLLFPQTEPLGERVTLTLEEGREQEFTIVGVTADFATSQLTTERPQLLLPLPDVSAEALAKTGALGPSVFLIARGAPGDEAKLKGALEQALRELGVEPLPGVAFPGIVTGQELVEKSLGDLVSESVAVAVAGSIVLILAALGIVGVVGFMVATRTREIAVRMALGSTRRQVFGLMLSGIVKLAIPGVAGGLLLAAVLIRTLEDVMGTPLTVGPTPLGVMEPLIYTAASAVAVAAALLAGLPAARRATSVQPMVAMRSE
ncbi:MAG: ABC transporter permease [Acidobacteriota bacterium]|nr:ABC transporter permease [Acidobacteriota bacterium]